MLKKFFKKSETNTSPRAGYAKEIIEIHNQFQAAGDQLLVQVNDQLKQAQFASREKIARLEKAGFINTAELIEGKKKIEKQNLSQGVIDLVSDYRMRYPNNKFISHDQVNAICKKYNLFYGDTENYIGFVPDKNLMQINSFFLHPKDLLYKAIITDLVFDFYTPESKCAEVRKVIKKKNEFYFGAYPSSSDVKMAAFETKEIRELISFPKITVKDNSGFIICAPEKDFKFEKKNKKGFSLSEFTKINFSKAAPDPVVLKEVAGGYLIITAWGDEASDEIVVNQNHN